MYKLCISWSTLKTVIARDGFDLHYVARLLSSSPDTYSYTVFGTNKTHLYVAPVESSEEVEDFEDNYKDSASSATSIDDSVALIPPIFNTSFAQQVELVPRVGTRGSSQWTICSQNWSKKTTWFQTAVTRSDIECTANESYTEYASGFTNWINPDDFTLASQLYNKGSAAGFGFSDFWLTDGTRGTRASWRPVIKKNGVTQTSGYTINYASGVITFGSALTSQDEITISGRTANETSGSHFIVRPIAGKKLIIPHVELNLAENLEMNSSAIFEIWAGDPTYAFENGPVPEFLAGMGYTAADLYCQYRMEYNSMHQIIGLSTGRVTKMEAIGGTSSVNASAHTGWSTDQKRGFTTPHYEVIFDFGTPSDFGQPIVLPSSVYAQLRVRLGEETAYGGEYSSVSFYAEEAIE